MRSSHNSTDPIILAKDQIISGGLGTRRPSDNMLVAGGTGTGKSMSVLLPNILYMENASGIGTFPKSEQTEELRKSLEARDYHVYTMNLANPEASDVFCDFLQTVKNTDDIESLSKAIIPDGAGKIDPYWNQKARILLNGLTYYVWKRDRHATYADVLEAYDDLEICESSSTICTSLDEEMRRLARRNHADYAVRCFRSFSQLPIKTASCIRDTMDAPIREMFPQSMRDIMRRKERIDFRRFVREKSFLMIITSPVKTATYNFANLFYNQAIKELFEISQEMPDGRLPRPVKLLFDDFACGCPIQDYAKKISIFRAAGISATMLIQSESQLESMYGSANATTIINNCSTYLYLGGMDLLTCRNISERINAPLEDVLYMPLGKVVIMQVGEKPIIADRYDTLNDPRYKEMMREKKRGSLDKIAS